MSFSFLFFLSLLYILPDPLSSFIGRCTLYTPIENSVSIYLELSFRLPPIRLEYVLKYRALFSVVILGPVTCLTNCTESQLTTVNKKRIIILSQCWRRNRFTVRSIKEKSVFVTNIQTNRANKVQFVLDETDLQLEV